MTMYKGHPDQQTPVPKPEEQESLEDWLTRLRLSHRGQSKSMLTSTLLEAICGHTESITMDFSSMEQMITASALDKVMTAQQNLKTGRLTASPRPIWDSSAIYGMDFAVIPEEPVPDPDKEFWDLVRARNIKKLCKQINGLCMTHQGHHNRKIQPNRGPVASKDWK